MVALRVWGRRPGRAGPPGSFDTGREVGATVAEGSSRHGPVNTDTLPGPPLASSLLPPPLAATRTVGFPDWIGAFFYVIRKKHRVTFLHHLPRSPHAQHGRRRSEASRHELEGRGQRGTHPPWRRHYSLRPYPAAAHHRSLIIQAESE